MNVLLNGEDICCCCCDMYCCWGTNCCCDMYCCWGRYCCCCCCKNKDGIVVTGICCCLFWTFCPNWIPDEFELLACWGTKPLKLCWVYCCCWEGSPKVKRTCCCGTLVELFTCPGDDWLFFYYIFAFMIRLLPKYLCFYWTIN